MNSKIKYGALAGVLLLLCPLFVRAETMPSERKTEKPLLNGQLSDARLENGKEILKTAKYIASNEASDIPLNKMPENEPLPESKTDTLRTENAQLNEQIRKLNLLLADRKYALSILNKSFDSLRGTSVGYTELETKYNEAALLLSKQNKKVDDLEDEVTKLLRQQNIRWFFSGCAVFLLGFIIGYSARREKRRSLF